MMIEKTTKENDNFDMKYSIHLYTHRNSLFRFFALAFSTADRTHFKTESLGDSQNEKFFFFFSIKYKQEVKQYK